MNYGIDLIKNKDQLLNNEVWTKLYTKIDFKKMYFKKISSVN